MSTNNDCEQVTGRNAGSGGAGLGGPGGPIGPTNVPGEIGGGASYGQIYTANSPEVDRVANSIGDLRSISPGETVFLGSNLEVPPDARIEVPNGASIVGDRGFTGGTNGAIADGGRETGGLPGAQLKVNRLENTSDKNLEICLIIGANVTISGIRLTGPIAGRSTPWGNQSFAGRKHQCIGIRVDDGGGVDIGNCLINGWTSAGVRFRGSSTGNVHHCSVIGQYWVNRGYGVATIEKSNSVIEYCWMNRNRHCTEAGDRASYTARNNIFGPTQQNHVCDMHPPGGTTLLFENNTFQGTEGAARECIHIRNPPADHCTIRNNWIYTTDKDIAITQSRSRHVNKPNKTHEGHEIANAAEGGFVKMSLSGNHWGESQPPQGVGAQANAN